MALAGIHVEFGYGGARGVITSVGTSAQPVFRLVSSENKTTAGTTTATAPAVDTNFGGEPLVRITAVADSFVAFGVTPNAAAEPRAFIPAGETRDYVVTAGHKVAWAAA